MRECDTYPRFGAARISIPLGGASHAFNQSKSENILRRRGAGDTFAMGDPRHHRSDGNEVWMWDRVVRRLYGTREWRGGAVLCAAGEPGGREGCNHNRGAVAGCAAPVAGGVAGGGRTGMRVLPARTNHGGCGADG